jgi:hypothetical protein
MKTIKDGDVSDRRVLVRVDFNVPLEGESKAPLCRYLWRREDIGQDWHPGPTDGADGGCSRRLAYSRCWPTNHRAVPGETGVSEDGALEWALGGEMDLFPKETFAIASTLAELDAENGNWGAERRRLL